MRGLAPILFLLLSQAAVAGLTVDEVIKSTQDHYPLIKKSLLELEASEMELMSSRGAFDSSLVVKGDTRPKGFYDGEYVEALAQKPFRPFNAKAYAGWRKGQGLWPSYEGKYKTLDEGETFAGLEFGLLRFRSIDQKRAKLRKSESEVEVSKALFGQAALQAKNLAYQAFYTWAAMEQIKNIKQELLSLAQKRAKLISRKVKSGALADIYNAENGQYLAQRKADFHQALQKYQQAAVYLSLFYRNSEGRPIIVSDDIEPAWDKSSQKIEENQFKRDLERLQDINPKLMAIGPKIQKAEVEKELGGAYLSPELKLKLEVSKDNGDGARSLQGAEQRIMLNFELPIERNLGSGAKARASAQIKALSQKRRYLGESLSAKLSSLALQVNAQIKVIENLETEVKLASRLERAEIKKFQSGGGDYFLVNIREQNTAKAKERLSLARLAYNEALVEYKTVVGDL